MRPNKTPSRREDREGMDARVLVHDDRSGGLASPAVTAQVAGAADPIDGERPRPDESATRDVAGLHLMVVDDDDHVRGAIRDAFEAAGWTVSDAAGGARALALLRMPPLPDVLVLDLGMPGVDGFAVLTELRSSLNIGDLPIVVLSARQAGLANRMAVALGADECVTKPVDPDALLSRCAALASGTEATRPLPAQGTFH